MDTGKLFLFGVAGFIILSLWNGNEPARKITVSEAAEATEIEPLPAFEPSTPDTPLPLVYGLSVTTVEEPFTDVNNEDTYEDYATYEYVRPRDMGTANTYTYRVTGEDDWDERVRGMVNTRGRYGSGYLRNEDGEMLWIETEWTEDGELLGYDADDNCYELETHEVR